MEFLQTIDFTLIGIVLIFAYELIAKSFNNYYLSMTGRLKTEDVGTSNCLFAMFYLFFVIYLLWNPVLWFPALLLLLVGILVGSAMRPTLNKVKESIKLGDKEDSPFLKSQMRVIKTYYFIDKILSLIIMIWMFILHLQSLGIIA